MSLSKWLPCDFEQCHPPLWGGGILVDHWSTISSCFCFFCFVLIGTKVSSFQHQTDELESSTLTHRAENPQAMHYRNSRLFCLSRSLPSKWFNIQHDNILFSCLLYWWFLGQCLKSLLKRVLHVLRNSFKTVIAQLSAPLRNLSRSKRPNEVKTVCFTNPLHSILVSAD